MINESAAPVTCDLVGGVAHLTLNRADKRNALDRPTIQALHAEVTRCADDPAVRVLQFSGAGKTFCAGADLQEMQLQVHASEIDNLDHAKQLARLLGAIDACHKPTLARVNGDGYGGALGLIAVCDIVVVADDAQFAFTEVRLGIIPAVISPFVLGKMIESAALRYFMSAEFMSAQKLKEVGLAHEVVAAGQLDAACKGITEAIMRGAPGAIAAAKSLVRDIAHAPARDRAATSLAMAARLARLRVQPEAREGFEAFFAKRKPDWRLN